MARDPQDLTSLCGILLEKADSKHQELPTEGGTPLTASLWKDLSIGVLSSEWGTDSSSNWKWSSAEVVSPEQKHLGFFSPDRPQ